MTVLEEVVATLKPMIRGVIHVGAHVANEAAVYDGIKDVLWVEANPEIFAELQENVRPFGHRTALALLSDKTGEWLDFHVMSGDKGSSSAHVPTRHLEIYPHITETHSFKIRSTRLDDLIAERGSDANMLVIDTQGHEIAVLYGADATLKQFDIVVAEAYQKPMYEGGATLGELATLMCVNGYSLLNYSQCEAVFVRSDLCRVVVPCE